MNTAVGAILVWAALQSTVQEREPVPSRSDQREAEKSIQDLFKDDYAKKTVDDRKLLAKKLLENALGSNDQASVRYVLLREARDLAVDGLDVDIAMKAIEEMARGFAIDVLAEKQEILSKLASRVREPQSAAEIARSFLRVTEEAVRAGDYDAAVDAAKKAELSARAARDSGLQAYAKEERAKANFVRSEYSKVKRQEKTLEKSPDDARANLAVGKFVCFVAGDWDRGLPMLVKGSDATLKRAAQTDVSKPEEASAQTSLGDMWWNLAEKERSKARKERIRSRAFYWYGQGFEGTSGIARMKIEKRLATASEFLAPPGAPLGKTDLVGGTGGGDFTDAPDPRAPLVGFRISITNIIKSIQPVFRSGGKKILGKTYGGAATEPVEIVARPGYAVGAIVAKGAARVDGFKVIFMRVKGMRLNRDDTYESDWKGGTGGGPETTLTGDGAYIVGIHGRAADDLDSLGLVFLK